MVSRLATPFALAQWLNTVTDGWFWTVTGCISLWLVLFLYLKARFSTQVSVIGSTWGVAFVSILFYFGGLVSQNIVFVFAVASALCLVLFNE